MSGTVHRLPGNYRPSPAKQQDRTTTVVAAVGIVAFAMLAGGAVGTCLSVWRIGSSLRKAIAVADARGVVPQPSTSALGCAS